VAQWRDVHVVLAVSGGADSMALLRAARTVKSICGGKGRLHVVHVDHRLRGPESTADAQWLARQCELLKTPLTICQGDVRPLAMAQGDGVEAAARDQRYQLLTQTAEQIGARYVVTGHTSDDQVETVLFRLLRGSGLRGISGIRGNRPLSHSVTLVRPLLDCWRRDLVKYLNSLGQPFREDLTNNDTHFTRNRIRLDLLPRLRSDYNKKIDAALLRLAHQAAAATQRIEGEAQQLLARCAMPIDPRSTDALATGTEAVLILRTAPLARQSELLACEAIRLAWRQAHLPEQAMSQHWWQKLAHFAQSTEAAVALQLPGKIQATHSGFHLVLSHHS